MGVRGAWEGMRNDECGVRGRGRWVVIVGDGVSEGVGAGESGAEAPHSGDAGAGIGGVGDAA